MIEPTPAVVAPTPVSTPRPTATPVPTAVPTQRPSVTPIATATPRPVQTQVPTPTAVVPTPTQRPVQTAVPTPSTEPTEVPPVTSTPDDIAVVKPPPVFSPVVIPTQTNLSVTLGQDGGQMQTSNGKVALEVPPGAIETDVSLELLIIRKDVALRTTRLPSNIIIGDAIARLQVTSDTPTPYGEFPVTVRIQYTEEDLRKADGDIRRMAIAQLQDSSPWVLLSTRTDTASKTLYATINHPCDCVFALIILPKSGLAGLESGIIPIPEANGPVGNLWTFVLIIAGAILIGSAGIAIYLRRYKV